MTTAWMVWAFLSASSEVMVYGDGATAAVMLAERLGSTWRVETAAPPASSESQAAEGLAALAAGRKAYDGMLFEESVPALAKAVTLLQAATLEPSQWPALWSAMLWLALAHEALGETAKRDAALSALAALDLDPTVAGADLPPAYRDRVRGRLAIRPVKSGALRIESSPAGADVFVNGRRRGQTPLLVAGLPGGEHTVTLARPGRLTWSRRVSVRAGFGIGADATPDLIEARLAPVSGTAAEALVARLRRGRDIPAAEREAAAAECRAADRAAALVAVVASGGTTALAVFADGRMQGPKRLAAGAGRTPISDDPLVATWNHWLLSASVHAPRSMGAERGGGEVGAERGGASGTRWWLWTTVGAVVAGGATAAAIAASSQPDSGGRRSGGAVVRW